MRNLLLFLFLGCAGSFGAELRITEPQFKGAKQPQIAISEEGKIYVAFGKDEEIYVTKSLDGGRSFGVAVKVGEVEKLALGMRRGPRIAAAGANVIVTAISHSAGNLYGWVARDEGISWARPVIINSVTNSAREGLHALAGNGKSKLISVWLDLRNGKTELWSSVSNDGGEKWEANQLVYKSPDGTICECCHPSVVFGEEGRIVVMWRNWLKGNRDMYQAESVDGGKTFSAGKKIGEGTWRLPGCPMDGGSIGIAGGTETYAWRREGKLFFTSEKESETALAESGTQPVVVATGKGFGYLWQDGGNLYWRSSGSNKAELFARNAGYATSAWSPKDQKAFVAWEGSDGIYISAIN